MGRAEAEWEAVRAGAAARRLTRMPAPPRPRLDRTAIVLGRTDTGAPVLLPERARLEHAHAIGTTGGGKTKFLELCIRQDIIAGRGVCVVDPHGSHEDSLYRSLLGWLDQSGLLRSRTVHLIDPNAATHTTGFNPLARPDDETDLSVIAGFCLDAFARAWGGEDMDQKPTIKRVISATFMALAELGLTLCEAEYLYDPYDEQGVRAWAIAHLRDRYARGVLLALHQLAAESKRDFRVDVVGPTNRLAEFVRSDAVRTIVGQSEHLLDLRAAMDRGDIILVNLSGGTRVYERDAELLGRLLTQALLFHAKRRRNVHRPFFVYLDECHRYLSGDLEYLLAEVRKYGVGLVLAHQWLEQLDIEGSNMLAAVRNATNLKAIFRLRDPTDAEDLALMAVPLDLEKPVAALIKPAVVGNQRVWLRSESEGEQRSHSDIRSLSEGRSYTEGESYAQSFAEIFAEAESNAVSVTETSSKGITRQAATATGLSQVSLTGTGSGVSTAQMMTPQIGWFDTPTVLGVNEGESSMTHGSFGTGTSSVTSEGIGSSLATGRAAGRMTGKSTMRGVALGEVQGRSAARGISRANTAGVSETAGTSSTRGRQEGSEPIFVNLPSAVHGKDNMLYFAAQTLRGLTTATAFINFVDRGGMKATLLNVPDVQSSAPTPAAFEALRRRIFEASPSSLPVQAARDHVSARERDLIARAQQGLIPPEPETPAGYRTVKKRSPPGAPAPEPEAPAGYRTKRKRQEKGKS